MSNAHGPWKTALFAALEAVEFEVTDESSVSQCLQSLLNEDVQKLKRFVFELKCHCDKHFPKDELHVTNAARSNLDQNGTSVNRVSSSLTVGKVNCSTVILSQEFTKEDETASLTSGKSINEELSNSFKKEGKRRLNPMGFQKRTYGLKRTSKTVKRKYADCYNGSISFARVSNPYLVLNSISSKSSKVSKYIKPEKAFS